MAVYSIYEHSNQWWARIAATLGLLKRSDAFSPIATYRMLEQYYYNNALYDQVREAFVENAIWAEGMLGLRNPANRVVEFYASKIWPGSIEDGMPIDGASDAVGKAIAQVHTWSNWASQKQVTARHFSMYGDWFAKIETSADEPGQADKVYIWPVKPEYVTDLREDKRGFLTFIRIDIPQVDGDGDYYTEAWDKDTQMYRAWRSNDGPRASLESLSNLIEALPLSEFGIDFIPFVHAKFRDVGDVRGVGCFTHVLDKIDEANRMATRLHQMLFRYNRPIFALRANDKSQDGRPMPAPQVGDGAEPVDIQDDTLLRLPGYSQIEAMVPHVNYEAALNIINAQLMELTEDLPELLYYRLREFGANISGVAARTILSPAADRLIEARGNIDAAMIRAHEMALTIGIKAGIFQEELGQYENGDFDHTIGDRDVFSMSENERLDLVKNEVAAGIPLRTALRRHGWTDEEIAQMIEDADAERERNSQALGTALLNAQRQFDGE